ncbi:MAG TPA: hypothetical protein VLF18_13850 [Tahibacter sp.]|uniref:hypothetical protein n=1 Tax=Tahibacter sp. TaxID=2056211 RepID=UPI002BCFBA6A|nr:hypothetical protein [Tahibacter sp.]HSX61279.1 hypothetical protein [Tahibacter sp.]
MSDDDSEAQVTQVMERVLSHLAQNPRAGDTADGVRRYWLRDDAIDPDIVERALRRLIVRGALHERVLPSSEIWYGATGRGA